MVSRFLKLSLFFMMTFLAVDAASAGPKLTWDPSTGDVTGYKLYYGDNSGAYDQQMDVGNQLECALSDLSTKDETKYYFAVKAYNDTGESDFSNEVSWESGDSTPPITPQGFSVGVEPGKAIMEWQLNGEDDLNGYYAYCGEASRNYGPPVPVGKNSSYTMSNLDEGKTYYFAVSAVDTAGNESGYSTELSKTIPTTPVQSPAPQKPSPDQFVYNLSVNSGKPYEIMDGLNDNKSSYIDRDYTYQEVPEALTGATYIKMANNDKLSSENPFLSFEINQNALVYIAHDSRITQKPDWLSNFTKTGDYLISADVPMT
ncbi:MAG: fibronectin type III domain-containing protein, partial [Thermodesulfobacteriota bacterium]